MRIRLKARSTAVTFCCLFILALGPRLSDATVGDGQGYGGRLPYLKVIRVDEPAGTEGWEVSCAPASHEAQCSVNRLDNGEVLAGQKIPLKRANEIVAGFLSTLPKGEAAPQQVAANETGTLLYWEASNGAKTSQGNIPRDYSYASDGNGLAAVLTLETVLSGEGGK